MRKQRMTTGKTIRLSPSAGVRVAAVMVAVVTVVEPLAAADDGYRPVVIRETSGWPDDPVEGTTGPYLSVRSTVDQTEWASVALPITLELNTKVMDFSGVMAAAADFDWPGATWRFNVWSSLEAFGDDGLVGDVISRNGVTISNLDDGVPPPFGGLTASPLWQKRFLEFAFEPFSLEAGSYVIGINAFTDSGQVGWAEAVETGGLPSDFGTSSINEGSPYALTTTPLSVTGVVAADIGGQLPPPPVGDLNADGVVDGADLGILLSAWGECSNCASDLNEDGVVNGEDLGILLANWTE